MAGLGDSAMAKGVTAALAQMEGCAESDIRVGQIRTTPGRRKSVRTSGSDAALRKAAETSFSRFSVTDVSGWVTLRAGASVGWTNRGAASDVAPLIIR